MRIAVAGEAVMDFTSVGDLLFQAHFGGSPLNTALAAARLGQKTGFLTQLSSDLFGQRLKAHLEANGVDLRFLVTHDAPTTLAFAVRTGASNRYAFFRQGSADSLYRPDPLPELPPETVFFQFGSVALLTDPAAACILALARRYHGDRIVVCDPNVRPSLIDDLDAYRNRFRGWCRHMDLLKVSDEDQVLLEPGVGPETAAMRWLDLGVRAVVVTRGADGALLFRPGRPPLAVPAPTVPVADTIGAGDTFSAGLLTGLLENGVASLAALAGAGDAVWARALTLAAAAAAINCTREGAQPPTRADVAAFMERDPGR